MGKPKKLELEVLKYVGVVILIFTILIIGVYIYVGGNI